MEAACEMRDIEGGGITRTGGANFDRFRLQSGRSSTIPTLWGLNGWNSETEKEEYGMAKRNWWESISYHGCFSDPQIDRFLDVWAQLFIRHWKGAWSNTKMDFPCSYFNYTKNQLTNGKKSFWLDGNHRMDKGQCGSYCKEMRERDGMKEENADEETKHQRGSSFCQHW